MAGVLTVAGAAIGLHAPLVVEKLRRLMRGGGHKPAKESEAEHLIADVCLDDLIRANVIWALVLELQGNSEEVIAKTLQRLLTTYDSDVVDSLEKTQELLHELEGRLRRLSVPIVR